MKYAKKRNICLRNKQTAIALKRMQEYHARTTSKFTQEIISIIKSTLNKIEKNKGENDEV